MRWKSKIQTRGITDLEVDSVIKDSSLRFPDSALLLAVPV